MSDIIQDSIFTKIIKGELPCHKIYEDDKIISILTIDPVTKGHTLVIPKEQVASVWDLEKSLYDYLFQKTKEISSHIQKSLQSNRVGMLVDGFGVPHTHIHLIPLDEGLSIEETISNWESNDSPDHDNLAKVAKKLKLG